MNTLVNYHVFYYSIHYFTSNNFDLMYSDTFFVPLILVSFSKSSASYGETLNEIVLKIFLIFCVESSFFLGVKYFKSQINIGIILIINY